MRCYFWLVHVSASPDKILSSCVTFFLGGERFRKQSGLSESHRHVIAMAIVVFFVVVMDTINPAPAQSKSSSPLKRIYLTWSCNAAQPRRWQAPLFCLGVTVIWCSGGDPEALRSDTGRNWFSISWGINTRTTSNSLQINLDIVIYRSVRVEFLIFCCDVAVFVCPVVHRGSSPTPLPWSAQLIKELI